MDSNTASVLHLNYPAPAASTSVTSTTPPTTGGYTDGEGQQSLSPHHQHQQQLQDQQLQDQQLHNLQDLAYDPHLLDFNSHHTFHSHPHAQSTSADVLSLDHQLHHHQHQHQHHHHHQQHQHQQHQHQQHQQHHHHLHQQHQLDSSGHHHAALASAIAAATSGSLTGDSLAGLAAHFQAGSHQHALPSLPPPLPTFAPMPHHHHDGSLPAVIVDSNSMASSHSGGGDNSGSGAYAHLQPQQRQQQQHTQVQLPPAAPLYCLCQQPYDGSCFMLACDHCNKWFHGKCVGITEESARRGEHSTYVCPSCVRSGGVGSHDHGGGGGGEMDIAEGHVGESGAPPATSTTDSTTTTTSTTTTGSSSTTSSTGEKRAREHGGGGDDGGDEEAGLGSGEVMVIRDEGMAGSIGGIDGGDGGEPTKKRRKTQMHQRGERLCRFPGCDKKITCRSYCPRHQKQKERCSKRGTLFSTSSSPRRKSVLIGRPSKIFSQTRNQRQKLKRFDEKINEFAGGEQEGTAMLEKYLNSSYGQKRLPSTKGDKMAQHIGQNAIQLINQLPPTSPLRKPLIKALGLGLSQSEIADTFHVSRKTVERSFALPSEENLLFSLVSRPRGMKAKSSADVPTLDAPLQVQLQQAGLYPPPPSGQSEHLEMDLGHSLPPSFTVEENGHISVSVTTRRSVEEEDDDNDNEDDEDEAMVGHGGPASGPGESEQTHVLLQGNVVPVASMMDEVDTTPLVFQGITGE